MTDCVPLGASGNCRAEVLVSSPGADGYVISGSGNWNGGCTSAGECHVQYHELQEPVCEFTVRAVRGGVESAPSESFCIRPVS